MKIAAYIRSLPTWTIVLSLFLNVLVIGTVFGALAFHHQASHHMLAKIQRAQNVLSPEGKNITKPIIDQTQQSFHGKKLQIKSSMMQIHTTLTAEKYDPDALKKNYQELRNHFDGVQAQIYQAIHDIAVDLPDEERRQFFQNVLRARYLKNRTHRVYSK